MIRFYLSMECHECEEDMFLGPVGTTITHNGLPVLPYDFASQESFCCDNCGTEHILGDFDYEVEGGDEAAPQPTTPGEAIDLDEIEARANAATPGPWHEQHIGTDTCVHIGDYGWVTAGPRAPEYDVDSEQGRDDAEFIAHARQDVPALTAEVRRLRGEWQVLTDRWGHYKRQYLGALEEADRLRAEHNDLSELATKLANAVEHVAGLDRPLTVGAPSGTNERAALETLAADARRAGLLPTPEELDAAPAADPGVYRLPDEPPSEVLCVRDEDSRHWARTTRGDQWWRPEATATWPELLGGVGQVTVCGCLSTTPPAEPPRCDMRVERDGVSWDCDRPLPCPEHPWCEPPAGTEGDDAH